MPGNENQLWIEKEDIFDANAYVDAARRAKASGQIVLAHSMLRSAKFLGADVDQDDLASTQMTGDQLLNQGVRYARNQRTADLVFEHFGHDDLSIVDIGGHTGFIAQFLKNANYLLCEPTINNMMSTDLVAAGYEFDVALAVHVFEHIPDDDKEDFFQSLLALGKKGVILCNPVDTGDAVERQKFLLEVFGPLQWIVEHLECGTPTIDIYHEYAERNDLNLEVRPNGDLFLSLALFAMGHFAQAANDRELSRMNGMLSRYINRDYKSQQSEKFPADYAMIFTKKK
ncbi:hypothetical protein GGD81_003320 [Rhodobium orientis]|uniref:Methyltransferase type 11 domain-containing protein n=1 Tax=Rhodobium orientis TaxID=34017 RepID=A0A327JRS2_9HYPH|nr:hypothetical protein [Rhodobium orientis]MBB4304262.1 hypothetical protein [Rhodobium orientis]MBK5948242.1 hypothetical protein [Rhodobium orientis]RAI28771.1 hypothetical protein CH339_05035 [Rhodobium orientis]